MTSLEFLWINMYQFLGHCLSCNDILASMVMDREAWYAAIHGVANSRTRMSDWTEYGSDPTPFSQWQLD